MDNSRTNQSQLHFVSPLHRASRQMAIYLEEEIDHLDVTGPEAHLLSYVDTYGPCPIGELVRVFGYKKTTMTGILDRLERRKLIRRALNPEDRRSFVVTATARGASLGRKARERVVTFDREVVGRVSKRDWQGFLKVLETVAEVTGVDVRRDEKSSQPARR